MALKSRAEATWQGSLTEGSGTVSAKSSANFSNVPVSWASRTEAHQNRTSPEELLRRRTRKLLRDGALRGSRSAGPSTERLDVSATVTFDKVGDGFKVTTSELTVRGKVPGVDAEAFKQAAEAAKDGCPIHGALKGNVALSVGATSRVKATTVEQPIDPRIGAVVLLGYPRHGARTWCLRSAARGYPATVARYPAPEDPENRTTPR